jgi:hypothetical protein
MKLEKRNKSTKAKEIEEALKIVQEIKERQERLQQIRDKENSIKLSKLIGNCYKFNNSYSCPESKKDHWWFYIKCCSKGEDFSINCVSFEKDKYGDVFLKREQKDVSSFDNSSYILISNKEYLREFAKFKKEVDAIELEITKEI